MTSTTTSVGYIELSFFDSASDQVICIGGAGFDAQKALDEAWGNVPKSDSETDFMADRRDVEDDIVDEKPVTAQTCEQLMGKPIAVLIAEGRARLEQTIASARQAANDL